MKIKTLISLLVILSPVFVISQDKCSDILSRGIYDYNKTAEERSLSFIYWYRNSDIKTYDQAKSSSLNATVPIDGILVELGFSKDETGFQKFQKLIEMYLSSDEKYKLNQTLQTINPQVVAAWERCISREGTHIWVEHTENPYEFVLCANYIGGGIPRIHNIDFGSGTIQNNNGFFKNADGKMNENSILNSAIKRQTFRRTDKRSFTLTVGVENGGNDVAISFQPIKLVAKTNRIEKLPPLDAMPTAIKSYGPYEHDAYLNFVIYQYCRRTDARADMKISAIDAVTKEVIASGRTSDIRDMLDFGLEFVVRLKKGEARAIIFEGWVNGCTQTGLPVHVTKTELIE